MIYKSAAVTLGLPERVRQYLAREFTNIAQAFRSPTVSEIELETHYAVPSKLYDGLTVLADGTSWNPGGGQGVYTYYGGAWNRLG